ncbi:MAG: type II secretion system F family protein, partial [Planctomycetaceae bacterium]
MPIYRYWATTDIGDTVSGVLTADTPDDAAHLLTLRGWIVRRMEPSDAPAEPVLIPDEDFDSPPDHAAPTNRENLPLTISLRALAEESSRFRTRFLLLQVVEDLERGQPIEAVFEKLESAYPRRLSALFEAGLKTGRLPHLMHQGLEQVRRLNALKRKVWFSLAYPFFLFVLTLLVGSGIIFGIVPQFAQIYDDFGTQIPVLTQAIINFSKIGWRVALGMGAALVVTVGVLTLLIISIGGRSAWHRILGGVPLIGGLFRAASLSGM